MNKEKLKRRQQTKIEASYISVISNDRALSKSLDIFLEESLQNLKEIEDFQKLIEELNNQ